MGLRESNFLHHGDIGVQRKIMLEIKNLHKSFDGVHAVDDFSLRIEPGKITSIIGPNGAGKTTVFNIVSGFLRADLGDIHFDGANINSYPAWKVTRSGISRTFQQVRLLKKMTVLENILIGIKKQRGEHVLNALFRHSSDSPESDEHVKHSEELLKFIELILPIKN